jgi:heptosyltransferase-3
VLDAASFHFSKVAARILVIRGGAIGDFILTLPAIRLLREDFPAAHIEVLGYRHIIAVAEGRYYVHAARSIEYSGLSGFFIPNGPLAADLVEYFGSFQQIISYLYDPDGFFEENIRRCGVKHFLSASTTMDDSGHAARQLARPLERLALFLDDPAVQLYPAAEDRAVASRLLGDTAGKRYVAIHPGSGSEKKNWPLDRWIELAAWISTVDPKREIVLVGGEADRVRTDALQMALSKSRVHNAIDLPLPHLAAVLERCALFIGHDSGVSHIAAAAGAPSVLLFGPTDPEVWAPANRYVSIVTAPKGNLALLGLDAVQNAIREQLG